MKKVVSPAPEKSEEEDDDIISMEKTKSTMGRGTGKAESTKKPMVETSINEVQFFSILGEVERTGVLHVPVAKET
jgi:hypothetical protein